MELKKRAMLAFGVPLVAIAAIGGSVAFAQGGDSDPLPKEEGHGGWHHRGEHSGDAGDKDCPRDKGGSGTDDASSTADQT
ncbi:MAG: hypothetical protein ACKVVT_01155 [Dehalococcoidia bacterium]